MGGGIISWFVGPQLIGVVFLLVGWIQKNWPPKKINNFYGYRSETAKKNKAAWDEGNRYSAIYMIKAGLSTVIIGLAITAALHFLPISANAKGVTTYLTILVATMGSVITMMVKTENHLERTFNTKKTE